MASASASCKSEKAQIIGSPLIGGLMEQDSPVVLHVKDGNNLIQSGISSDTSHADHLVIGGQV